MIEITKILQTLLIYVSIKVTYCQDCPAFDGFINNETLKNELHGTFLTVYAGEAAGCNRLIWNNDGGVITAYAESYGCCIVIDEYIVSEDFNQYNITPTTETETACGFSGTYHEKEKLVASTGTDDTLCLIVSICRGSGDSLIVMCRQPPLDLFWFLVTVILPCLANLLSNLFTLIAPLQSIQENLCIYGSTCPT